MPQTMFDDEDGTLAMLRDSVAGFAEAHPGARHLRARRKDGGDLDRALWSAMAEAGWLGLMLPASLGGAGLSIREQAVLSEALGRALLTEPVAQLAIFSGTLLRDAPAGEERDRLLRGIADGTRSVSIETTAPPACEPYFKVSGPRMTSTRRAANGSTGTP